MELDTLMLGEVKSCLIASRRVEVCGFGAKGGSWKTAQNGELAVGSCAVGGTVSSPLRSFLLRCPLYILETWTCAQHYFGSLVPGLPGGSAWGRDAQSLIWTWALIRGMASWWPTPCECPSESIPCRASYRESGERFAVGQFIPAPWCLLCGTTWNGSGAEGSGVGSMWLNHVDFTPNLSTTRAECLLGCGRPIQSPSMAPLSRGLLMLTRHLNKWIGTMLCDLKRSWDFLLFQSKSDEQSRTFLSFHPVTGKICIQQMKC